MASVDLNGPAELPPPGITSNLDNPDNRNELARGILTACTVIATICMLVRVYGRVVLLRKIQIEEGTLFMSGKV